MLRHGDCLDAIQRMPDNSVDSIVTDPPYHLTSVVKRFGAAGAKGAIDYTGLRPGATGAFARASKGFMGRIWDGGDIAFQPETWAEMLRVLKPGGHLLAFAAPRNQHRMICAIEDAGFEVRDMLMWLFGTGFPKSLNLGSGRGTALKPAFEPICLARKSVEGTIAQNVMTHRTGALNIDACRIPLVGDTDPRLGGAGTWGTSKMAKNAYGTFAGSEVGSSALGRWPANALHDGSDEVVRAFPTSNGSGSARTLKRGERREDEAWGMGSAKGELRDAGSGSAARFFYCAKANAKDRAGSKHPTVKPISLMRYLVRLVTPPGGTVLDPFAGSGSTGEAAILEGRRVVMIEREDDYATDIIRRMTSMQRPRRSIL